MLEQMRDCIDLTYLTEEHVYDYGHFLIDQILQGSNDTLSNYPPCPLPHITLSGWTSLATNSSVPRGLWMSNFKHRCLLWLKSTSQALMLSSCMPLIRLFF